jgi:uncharacterized protein (TIGR03089 family)
MSLLAAALRRDSARPLVTFYDLDAGGRVELSAATFDNWVAKTAGLLRDDLGVEPGTVVSVVLPAHWLGLVWVQAVWTAGARLALEPLADAAVAVRAVAEPASTGAGELVVVNTAPLGGPAGAAVPAGALDYGRDVLAQPDRFVPMAEPATDALLDDLLAQAERRASTLGRQARLLVTAERVDPPAVRDGLLVPLLLDGSVVLVRGAAAAAAPDRLPAIATDERVTSWLTTGPC